MNKITRILYKAFLYRLIIIIADIILLRFLLGTWKKSLHLNIWLQVVAISIYIIYEFIFTKK